MTQPEKLNRIAKGLSRPILKTVALAMLFVLLLATEGFSKDPPEVVAILKGIQNALSDVRTRLDHLESATKEAFAKPAAEATSEFTVGQAAYWSGRAAIARNDCADAIDKLTSSVRLDPQNDSAFLYRGDCFLKLGEGARALDDLNGSIRLQPHNSRAYQVRAAIHLLLKQPDLALGDLRQAIERDPANVSYSLSAGRIAEEGGDFATAIQIYTAAQTIHPDSIDLYSRRASAYLRNGQSAEALADCERLVSRLPERAPGYYCRADWFVRKGQYSDALRELNEVVRRDPMLPEATSLLATLQPLMAINGAINTVSTTAEASTEGKSVFSQFPGVLFPAQTSPPENMADRKNALPGEARGGGAGQPNEAGILLTRGREAMNAGRVSEAVALYTRGITLDPSNAILFNSRGYAYTLLHQYVLAIKDLNEAIRIRPDYPNASANRANALRLSQTSTTASTTKGTSK